MSLGVAAKRSLKAVLYFGIFAALAATVNTIHAEASDDGGRVNAEYCSNADFQELYSNIAKDLKPWKYVGITASLMDWVLGTLFPGTALLAKGVGLAFRNGKPYITTDPKLFNTVGHHKRLIAAHLALFEALSATFGTALPDVEVVVATNDEPRVLLPHYSNSSAAKPHNTLPPILRFCKSASFADILVPDIHFAMRNFTAQFLGNATDGYDKAWPWQKKKEVLFGRFAPYQRFAAMQAPELYRKGTGGANICRRANPELWFCNVRKHFLEWTAAANATGGTMDVAAQPRKDMLHHSSHKWLLHLDGQSCSSRLEQLLALGSLVVKEESGYYAFFHHLLQPYQHYVPFWREVPEEVLGALQWAREHNDEAERIAQQAQQLANRYLHKRAIMCYWFTLLKEMGALMRYTPGPDGGARRYEHWVPAAEYLEREGYAELTKRKMLPLEFWD